MDALAHVTLDGTRSRSPAGAITSWSWVQTAGPGVALAGADTARPSFDAPAVDGAGALLSFALTVGDGNATAVDTIDVDVREAIAVAPRTTLGKIRRAMQEGSLDRETAVKYLAFAMWGDPRLPAELVGDPSRSASWARAVVSAEFATLSDETKAIVLPFLLPPGHAEGYSAPESALRTAASPMDGLPPAERRSVEGAHVVVWYRTTLANGAITASDLVNEIENKIWPTLHEVWTDAHMPVLADGNVGAAFNGVHGKLNVYLEPLFDYGYMQPYGDTAPLPTYVVLRQSLPFSGKNPGGLIESAAHEITHSCQYSFQHKEKYAGHRFLYEAVATWGEDDVYPTHNSEQEYAPSLLDQTTLPLEDDTDTHPYGAYLLFQWVTRGSGDRAFVRRAFENAQTQGQIPAVDAAFQLPGDFRFEQLWGQFVDQIWNRNPGESFWGLDDLTAGAQAVEAPLELTVDPATGDAGYVVDVGVKHLAARIYRMTLTDTDVHTIHFFDGFYYDLEYQYPDGNEILVLDPLWTPDETRGAVTRMFLKRGDHWTSLGHRSPSVGDRSICQDTPADEVQEIAIAFGDSIPEKGHSLRPRGELPLVWVTNIGCDHWEGTVSAQTSPDQVDVPRESITATNVLFTRHHPAGMDTGELAFRLESADVSWTMSGQVGNCSFSGSQSWRQTPANGIGGLQFQPTIMSGGSHRIYGAGAKGELVPVSYTVTCTWPDSPPTVTTETKIVEWLKTERAADPAWNPKVSSDGQDATGEADDGQMKYTWTFHAYPGLAPLGN